MAKILVVDDDMTFCMMLKRWLEKRGYAVESAFSYREAVRLVEGGDFDAVLNINLKGTFNTIRHLSRQMLKQRSGKIINISSVSGILGNAGQANYAASKAGVIGLTKTMARELASRGITVNAVAPGFVDTEMTEVLSEEVKEAACRQIPLGRFGKPSDIANMVAYLASEKADYITGQVFSVDGGMNI